MKRPADWELTALLMLVAVFVVILFAAGCPASRGADPDFAAFAGEEFVAFGPVPCDAQANRPKATEPAPAPRATPTNPVVRPQLRLWRLWDAHGNTWLEYRDAAPQTMPAPQPAPPLLPGPLTYTAPPAACAGGT